VVGCFPFSDRSPGQATYIGKGRQHAQRRHFFQELFGDLQATTESIGGRGLTAAEQRVAECASAGYPLNRVA
jgi:hypothetical protein